MARKLKGKVSSKGLKGALARYQNNEKLHGRVKGKEQHILNKSKPPKQVMKNKQLQKLSEQKYIPFEYDSTLLLVGDGNFSYARSILEQGYIKAENLIVTSYDSGASELSLKYPNSFKENYEYITSMNVKVLFHIGATNLLKSFKLSKKTTWSKIMGPAWAYKRLNYIMFNFPHTGSGIKDQERNIISHQELVFGYFNSSMQLLSAVNDNINENRSKHMNGYTIDVESNQNARGKVIISLFTGEPYDSWQVKTLARQAGLKLLRSAKFQWENYAAYHHRRTNNEMDTTKPAEERDARLYVFEKFDKNRHSRLAEKQKVKDDDSE